MIEVVLFILLVIAAFFLTVGLTGISLCYEKLKGGKEVWRHVVITLASFAIFAVFAVVAFKLHIVFGK